MATIIRVAYDDGLAVIYTTHQTRWKDAADNVLFIGGIHDDVQYFAILNYIMATYAYNWKATLSPDHLGVYIIPDMYDAYGIYVAAGIRDRITAVFRAYNVVCADKVQIDYEDGRKLILAQFNGPQIVGPAPLACLYANGAIATNPDILRDTARAVLRAHNLL